MLRHAPAALPPLPHLPAAHACLPPLPPQACHVSSWDHALLASHTHVTNRHPALRRHLRGVLMGDPEIAGRLCQLSAVFGYAPEVPECGGDGGGSGAAAAAGAGQQQGEEEGQAPVDKSRH